MTLKEIEQSFENAYKKQHPFLVAQLSQKQWNKFKKTNKDYSKTIALMRKAWNAAIDDAIAAITRAVGETSTVHLKDSYIGVNEIEDGENASPSQLKIFERHLRHGRENILQAFISKGGYLVVDYRAVTTDAYYHDIYGRRGGLDTREMYPYYDYESMYGYGMLSQPEIDVLNQD
jgi:hypothetical protein